MLVLLTTSLTSAGVVRFDIIERTDLAEGKPFGEAGAYERIVGKVYFAIDPQLPQNREIRDLNLAPVNDQGLVEFASDLDMLVPKDLSKANRAVLYDVNNRGNKLGLAFFNYGGGSRNDPRTEKEAGDGFLMRKGFVVVWSGWNGELLPGNNRLRLYPPVARRGQQPITGPVRCEIVSDEECQRIDVNWGNHGSYRPTPEGLANATLTVRKRARDPRIFVPRDQWQVHVTEVEGALPSQLPRVELEIPAGIKRGLIYELIYEAQDPIVHGVCFAAVRDLITAFKYGEGENNPLVVEGKPAVNRAHGFGVSQSGRFLRELLCSGFNQDEQGRKVFDGLIPHVAGGGLGSFNYRFAQPTRHNSQHDHSEYPGDRFPFAFERQTDPLSGKEEGILDKAIQTDTVPYVLHTQSEAEYWTRAGSLVHTDPLGRKDAQVPANVRIFAFGGTQHGPAGYPPRKSIGKYLSNPGDYKPFLRALLLSLDNWVTTGEPVPASVYPRIEDGTLVDWTQSATGFPEIPGVRFPKVIRQPELLDFGPRWESERIMDFQPPRAIAAYRVLVPKCDADGNAVGCLNPPEVQVPVATYTGWNLRSAEAGGEDELYSLVGSYIPFAKSKQERKDDPRPSVQERYGSFEAYRSRLEQVCSRLVHAGYLLEEDAENALRRAEERVKPLFE